MSFKKQFLLIGTYFFLGCQAQLHDPSYVPSGQKPAQPPVITIYSFLSKEYVMGGSVYPFKFKVNDSLGFNASKLEFSRDGGSTWEVMSSSTGQNAQTFPTLDDQIATFNWAVPQEPVCLEGVSDSDSSQYIIRVTSAGRPNADFAVKTTQSLITVDSCAPVLNHNSFNVTGYEKGFFNFSLNSLKDLNDMSPIKAVCIKANSATPPGSSDSCWQSLKALYVLESANPSNFDLNVFSGFKSGTFYFYLWAMDKAGNITTMNSDTGTASNDSSGTDYIDSYVRDCSSPGACSLALNIAFSGNINSLGSGYVMKSDAPDASSSQIFIDPKFFVVTSRGVLIFRDAGTNTIKKINLLTGSNPTTLIANGASIIDGDQTEARVFKPARIALDFDENLYILDYDRIRKVTFASEDQFRITTVIGGGGDSTSSTYQDPLAMSLAPYDLNTSVGANLYWGGTFEVIQDGRILFSSKNPFLPLDKSLPNHTEIRIFDAREEAKVQTLNFGGLGVNGDSAVDTKGLFPFSNFGIIFEQNKQTIQKVVSRFCPAETTCANHYSAAFLFADGQSVGEELHPTVPSQWSNGTYLNSKAGDLYHMNSYQGQLSKMNPVSQSWDKVLGTNTIGTSLCVDGTLATSCSVRIWGSYIGNNNNIFFIDQGKLRFVDIDGKIRSISQ